MTTIVSRTVASTTEAITELAIRLTAGDKEPIRGMKTPSGRSVYSIYDAMWNTGAYKSRDAVTSAWTTLLKSVHSDEVRAFPTHFTLVTLKSVRLPRTANSRGPDSARPRAWTFAASSA